jgi:nitroreductase
MTLPVDLHSPPLQRPELISFLEDVVIQRRATPHFSGEPVPTEVIETALSVAAQAPSGYNFQPWRFLVLSDPEQRRRLQAAAFGQPKIGEAPVVIVAFAQREGWKEKIDEIFELRAEQTGQRDPAAREKTKKGALDFISQLPAGVWVTRQVMISFTYLMLAFESQGWDTAPMEGFDAAAVRAAFELPADAEVVALLAVGRAAEVDPPHPGRLPVSEIAYRDRFDTPFTTLNSSEL